MKFTKLTEVEQAEFLELAKDCFDPELLTEDDLPWLRASKKRWEEEQQRGEPTIPEGCNEEWDEDLEHPGDWLDHRAWERG